MISRRSFIGLLALPSSAAGLEKIDVFRAGDSGYTAYRIPGLIVTEKGTLIAYAEARKKSYRDWGYIDIVMRRSADGGRTWTPPVFPAKIAGTIARNPVAAALKLADPGDITYNNPMLIASRDGIVHCVFCVEYMRAFHMRSADDGVSWSTPVEITGAFEAFRKAIDWKVLASGPGHGIETRKRRLIVPVWLALGTGSNGHGDSTSSVIYSDDGGRRWQAGEIAFPNTPDTPSPGETIAVELADGRIMLNARNHGARNRRLVSVSKDGARNWSKPRYDDALLEPRCMAGMARHRKGILFSNPYNLDRADGKAEPGGSRDRKNLSVQLSYDHGRTWPVRRAIEPGWSGYSDLAVGPDGTVYCFYEHGEPSESRFRPVALKLARFDIAWLAGKG